MSAPVFDFKITFRPGFQADMDARFAKLQFAFSQKVAATVDPYVPFDTGTLVQQWKAVIESMRGGSFYTRAEVDALLKSLKSVDPFPVGSIYQSTARTSPAALFGGTWEQIASERVLMGAGSGHAAGTTVEAGLPNITGSFVADVKMGEHKVSGAFTAGDVIGVTGEYSNYSQVYKFSLDASKSNAIYGRSYTVQPAAYYVHIWKRVA